MVMEVPSAQCVGREFVRQYYTLLHKAPEFLHRFYSHNSSFVHGGVEKPGEEQPPVQGQTEIHHKIQSLNFRDCRAKIRQVDSQATVGSAVVVQVSGELSNAGQPMRRFMQTFVLAPQSPKKYYVHNDIFRYQDEVFHDSDNDTETLEESVAEADMEHVRGVTDQEADQDQHVAAAQAPAQFSCDAADPVAPVPQEPVIMSNGNATTSTNDSMESPDVSLVAEAQPDHQAQASSGFEPAEVPEPTPEVMDVPVEMPAPHQPKKPVSWAQRASMNTAAPSMPTQSAQAPKAAHTASKQSGSPPQATVAPRSGSDKPSSESSPATERGKPKEQREQRVPRRSELRVERDSSRSGAPAHGGARDGPSSGMGGGEADDFRRAIRLPDSQQLFVGNLPHNVGDKELREQFEEYGKVLEVRINRKNGRGEVPNFGFVVFDHADAVAKALAARPIYRDTQRLNVEEKKQRGEQSARPGSGMRSGPRGGGMGMRGGPRGGRGGGMSGRGGGMDGRGPSDRGRNSYSGPPPPRR